jgi:hypothetical protein
MLDNIMGSPIFLFGFMLLVVICFLYSIYLNKRCKLCKKGRVKEVLVMPQGADSVRAGLDSATKVRMKFVCKCDNCGVHYEVVGSR